MWESGHEKSLFSVSPLRARQKALLKNTARGAHCALLLQGAIRANVLTIRSERLHADSDVSVLLFQILSMFSITPEPISGHAPRIPHPPPSRQSRIAPCKSPPCIRIAQTALALQECHLISWIAPVFSLPHGLPEPFRHPMLYMIFTESREILRGGTKIFSWPPAAGPGGAKLRDWIYHWSCQSKNLCFRSCKAG